MEIIKTDTFKVYHFNVDRQHPYPGLFSFREEDKDYFFGRKREIADLVNLIGSNLLTVIFGKSGVGKTSLLRAGLIPKLKGSYFLPIYLRINFYNQEKAPIVQAKETIIEKISGLDPKAKPFEDLTLWEYFSFTEILNGYVTPLLFFDQFEEIFTTGKYNPDHLNEFVTELADLIENRVPLKVREKLEKENKTISHLESEHNLRVIISLREDYLPQLESLYRYIPSLRFSRYRVSRMRGKDAVDAVLKPGKDIIKDPEVGVDIINKIPGAKGADYTPFENTADSWEAKKIEPFLLSLFCYQVNEKRLEKETAEISRELVKSINTEDIIKDYYEENIARFNPCVKTSIEDLLITDEGYRKLQDVNSFKALCGVTDEEIEGLVDRRIIRKETRLGLDYVELIHDVLTPILKKSRDNRKEEERRKKEAVIRKKRTRRIIAAVAAVAIAILAGFTKYALDQKAGREKSRMVAEEEKQKRLAYERAAYAIDVRQQKTALSFRLAENALKADKNNLVAYRALLSVFYDGGIYREISENRNNEFSNTVSEKADFFAAFSPDGERILTVTSDKAILWKLEEFNPIAGEELRPGGGLEFRPNSAFSPDGKFIVLCTKSDDQVILWDLEKNVDTLLKLEGGVNSVAFSPDKNRNNILVASRDKKIRLFDLSGKVVKTFEGHREHVHSAAFSNDGKYIVSAGWDKTVRRWDLAGNQLGESFKDNKEGVNSAVFSADGQFIVTAAVDGSVRLWDLKDNKKNRTLGTHKGEATSAVFSPDGEYILTGSEDKTVRLLTKKNFLVFEFTGFKDIIHTASFSPDGTYILITPARGPAQLRLIDQDEIISEVNRSGIVRELSYDEKETYNLHDLK